MLVKDLKDFVRIPERIRAVRSQLADFVERKAESPEAIQGVASPR